MTIIDLSLLHRLKHEPYNTMFLGAVESVSN